MHSNKAPIIHYPQAAYVQYLYESGRLQMYRQPAERLRWQSFDAPNTPYDFSTDPHPWAQFEPLQTVEQIVARGYLAVPRADPTTAILSDKQHVSWLGLDDVVTQVRHRYDVYGTNMHELEQAKCSAITEMFMREAEQAQPASDRQQYAVGKRLHELYAEQRAERVNLWRDVSRLKLALPENAQQYLGAYRKMALLREQPGDAP